MQSAKPRYTAPSKDATVAEANEVRQDQLEHADDWIHSQLSKGRRISIKAPSPLTVSGRVLIATFLLPFEAAIDQENGRQWVRCPKTELTL
jgi:hypothetical protein